MCNSGYHEPESRPIPFAHHDADVCIGMPLNELSKETSRT